jgi:predicted MFS family arabinose efflux permease
MAESGTKGLVYRRWKISSLAYRPPFPRKIFILNRHKTWDIRRETKKSLPAGRQVTSHIWYLKSKFFWLERSVIIAILCCVIIHFFMQQEKMKKIKGLLSGWINSGYKLLMASYGMSLFSEWIILPIYAIFVQRIWWDILDASWAMATFLITQWIFTIIIQRLKRTKKHRIALLVWWWAIWVIGISLYITISSTLMLFITQILTALGNAIADPIFDEELSNNTDPKNKLFERWLFEGMQDIVNGVAALIWWIIVVTYWFKSLIFIMIWMATLSLISIIIYVKRHGYLKKAQL